MVELGGSSGWLVEVGVGWLCLTFGMWQQFMIIIIAAVGGEEQRTKGRGLWQLVCHRYYRSGTGIICILNKPGLLWQVSPGG